MYLLKKGCLGAFVFFGMLLCASEPKSDVEATEISLPEYSGGGYGDATWLFLRPTVTDSDLQYGTFLTLTNPPANLTAHVLELEPDYRSAFRVNLGYLIPQTSYNVEANYFYFHSGDFEKVEQITFNQFVQNFLGASYATAKAKENQTIHQVDWTFGAHVTVDQSLDFHPQIGLRYSDVSRHLKVGYTDLVLNPFPSDLKGRENSHYWGVGPTVDAAFKCVLYEGLSLTGHLGASALIGNISSSIRSNSVRGNIQQSFRANDSHCRVVPVVNTGLALTYTHAFHRSQYALEFTLGYEVDYYFDVFDRINPFNGYVNNPNTKPVRTSSNLGLGGPYARISLIQVPLPSSLTPRMTSTPHDVSAVSGVYMRMTNAWLKPSPSNQDLMYAILRKSNGTSQRQFVMPGYRWSGRYDLGYKFPSNFDIWGSYFHYDASDSSSVTAKANEGISSVNASGLSTVLFSRARSRIHYDLDQVDLLAGKYIQLGNPFNLHAFLGLRYLDLERKANNGYFGGEPPLTTQTKTPKLKSDYWGVGPVFGLDPRIAFAHYFALIGHFDVALLVGKIESKLDQKNQGLVGDSSNTLRTGSRQLIVPVVDARGGLTFSYPVFQHFLFDLEVGYQFAGYYKAVNQVYPTLLTGLEQTNSNLILTGPYLTVGLSGLF